MFEGADVRLTPRMLTVELAKYLGVGHRQLADSPQWFLDVLALRMREEAAYAALVAQRAKSMRK